MQRDLPQDSIESPISIKVMRSWSNEPRVAPDVRAQPGHRSGPAESQCGKMGAWCTSVAQAPPLLRFASLSAPRLLLPPRFTSPRSHFAIACVLCRLPLLYFFIFPYCLGKETRCPRDAGNWIQFQNHLWVNGLVKPPWLTFLPPGFTWAIFPEMVCLLPTGSELHDTGGIPTS